MQKIDIQKRIKYVSSQLKTLEKINEIYLKLKEKYNDIEVYYNDYNDKSCFKLYQDSLKEHYNINYRIDFYNDYDYNKTYISRKIKDKEFNIEIEVYYDLEVLIFYFQYNLLKIKEDYYTLPKDLVSKLEEIILDYIQKYNCKILNEVNSEKVCRFLDNLIFI